MEFGVVGDSLASKQKYVQSNGIIKANIAEIGKGFRIGDVVITTDGKYGHGFVVADMDEKNLYAAESNFNLDKKVTYGRIVPKDSPKIYGLLRNPLKLDLGVCEFNVNVFFNNQPKWSNAILDKTSASLFEMTKGKLKVNFYPLRTNFERWWYEDFVFNGVDYKVIAKSYLDEKTKLFSFTSDNKPANAVVFVINPAEWQGSSGAGQELAWTNNTPIGQIQASCGESDMSPWYDLKLIEHVLIHELSHYLNFINGKDDKTDYKDTPKVKKLNEVYNDVDFNRVTANL